MTRDEWYAYIAAAPATSYQRGRIMAECARLGITGRPERLAICAALAGLEDLDSTHDLVHGDAGRIVNVLLGIADRAELLAAAGLDAEGQAPEVAELDGGGQAHEQPAGATLAAVIRDLIVQIYATITPTRKAAP